MEKWKNIEGFEAYEVSDMGNVRRDNRLLKGRPTKNGYLVVALSINSKYKNHYIHRLVATAFLDKVGRVVNHIDGVKTNNNSSNLEWTTYSKNTIHAYNNKLIYKDFEPESGYKGVRPSGNKYMARISRNKKSIYIGMYETAEEAHKAYLNAVDNYEI
jgi:hypothetical protein